MAIAPLHGVPSPDLKINRHSPCYWCATFDYPPLNLFNNDTFLALLHLVEQLEVDPDVKVVVFDSANTDYYIAFFDLVKGFDALPNCQTSSTSGRSLSCALRVCQSSLSRKSAAEPVGSGPEVGAGLVLGCGGLEWLPRHVGRSRALKIVLGAEDFDAETAELYGWINRAVADDLLDGFVDKFSQRIAGFDKKPLVAAKRLVNDRAGLPRAADMVTSGAASWSAPGSQRRKLGELYSTRADCKRPVI